MLCTAVEEANPKKPFLGRVLLVPAVRYADRLVQVYTVRTAVPVLDLALVTVPVQLYSAVLLDLHVVLVLK